MNAKTGQLDSGIERGGVLAQRDYASTEGGCVGRKRGRAINVQKLIHVGVHAGGLQFHVPTGKRNTVNSGQFWASPRSPPAAWGHYLLHLADAIPA